MIPLSTGDAFQYISDEIETYGIMLGAVKKPMDMFSNALKIVWNDMNIYHLIERIIILLFATLTSL